MRAQAMVAVEGRSRPLQRARPGRQSNPIEIDRGMATGDVRLGTGRLLDRYQGQVCTHCYSVRCIDAKA
jgi:hypothetical protein